jgi:DinB superfamily
MLAAIRGAAPPQPAPTASEGRAMTTAVSTAARPDASEHAPYYGKYIAMVPETDAILALESQIADALSLLETIPEARGDHRYGPDKWTIKEVIGHLIDGERVFAYRAMRFARDDRTELPGFDENTYVPAGGFGRRTLADLAGEWELVRRSNIAMFRGLDAEAWRRQGVANGNAVSVRALAFIIAGHGRHHAAILRERYLP